MKKCRAALQRLTQERRGDRLTAVFPEAGTVADTRSDFLRDEIRREILSGRLGPGARLPTERDLAARPEALTPLRA